MLAGASKAYFLDLPMLRTEIAQHKLRLPASFARSDNANTMSPATSLPSLPSFDQVTSVVEDLQAVATANGLTVSDGAYKHVEDSRGSNIGHLEIVTHIKGGYVLFQKSVRALLAAHESLALDSITIQRSHSSDTSVDVEAQFSFFYRR